MITHRTDSHRRHTTVGGILLLLIVLLTASAAIAVEPRLIPFQARLTDDAGTDLSGVFQITFVIYDAPTGGTALWSEDHPSASIIDGRLNVLLGSLADLDDPNGDADPADAVQFDRARFVGIKVGADTNQEMVPRHQLVPAFHSRSSDALTVTHADGKTSAYGIDRITPIGLITPFYGNPATLPDNWKLCDGSPVTDPESPLDGETLPDLRMTFVRGEGDRDRNIISDGAVSGGSDEHTHPIPNEPHSSTGIAAGHNHTFGTNAERPIGQMMERSSLNGEPANLFPRFVNIVINNPGNPGAVRIQGYQHDHPGGQTSLSGEHNHTVYAGVGHGHGGNTGSNSLEVVPPYMALHYIIRIK